MAWNLHFVLDKQGVALNCVLQFGKELDLPHSRRHQRHTIWAFSVIILVIGLAAMALFFLKSVTASTPARPAGQQTAVFSSPMRLTNTQVITPTHANTDLACRLCHEETEEAIQFPSGETLSVQVDPAILAASAHGGQDALVCTDCHQPLDDYQFPHPPVGAADIRSYELARSAACESCHLDPHLTSHPDLSSENPVVCTDCHGAHDVQTAAQWQTGEETAVCVQCHTEAGVERTDPQQLTAIIQGGLFTGQVDNDYCLSCHSQPGLTYTFENGDTLSLTIDEEAFHDSVHGVDNPEGALACNSCHENYTYPHEPVIVDSAREYNLAKYPVCSTCHERKYEETLDDVHGRALEEGNLEAAVCTDCHGAHDTPPPDEPRERISHTCQQCHSNIFDEYATSVHGDALLSESNPDVPTCIECHGVHGISDPTTALFRIRSPELCAQCHADEELMNKYDISTDVFETYVADFHGTTVTLFEHQDPNVETNKAVCYDCHGVHDIRRPDDPESGIKANLLETCRQCHPDASANFPDAWTSHFKPSLENNTVVFLVNLFYTIVIPLTVGFFGFLVLTDVYRRIRLRLRE